MSERYIKIGDTNPGTQVWQLSVGALVANNAAAFLAWLTAASGEIRDSVQGAADNGAGLIRLTLNSTATLTTGEYLNVAGVVGTTEANANWAITVIDATHIDLQASAFVNAYVSGGTLTGAFRFDTKAELNTAIIAAAKDSYPPFDITNALGVQAGATVTLTNPLASIITVTPTNVAGLNLKLPQMNLPGSFPTSRPLRIVWLSGSSDLRVRDSANNLLATIKYNVGDAVGRYYVELWLEDINVSPGDFFIGPVTPMYDISAAAVATLLSETSVATVKNKTLDYSCFWNAKDTNFIVSDNVDTTKQFEFQASGITAGNLRILTAPDANCTLAAINYAQTWTAAQNYGDGNFKLNGATSGTLTQKAAAVAGANTITWPAGTTDFSATGGTGQFLKQAGAGAAITVAQPATSDLSDFGTANINTSGTIKTTNATASSSTITGAIVATGGIASGDRIYCASGFLAGAVDGSTAFTLFAAGGNRLACNVGAAGSGGTFTLYDYAAGSATQCLTAYKGSIIPGPGSALATNATDGFAYVPSCAGVPTGTPTAFTGTVAVVYDSTDNRLYANSKPVAGWVFIESLTMTGASVNSSTFDTNFDDFMFVYTNLVPATNNVGIGMLVKSGGSYQNTTYLNQSGVTTYMDVSGSATVANTASKGMSGVGYLLGVTGSDYKFFGAYVTVQQAAGTPGRFNVDGYWNGGTGTITGAQFAPSSGNWTSGTIKIYGLRKS